MKFGKAGKHFNTRDYRSKSPVFDLQHTPEGRLQTCFT